MLEVRKEVDNALNGRKLWLCRKNYGDKVKLAVMGMPKGWNVYFICASKELNLYACVCSIKIEEYMAELGGQTWQISFITGILRALNYKPQDVNWDTLLYDSRRHWEFN